jgi:hypothetical protein
MMTQDGTLYAAQRHHEDSSILRWGGLAGIGGSVLFVVVFAIVGIFAGPEPAGPAGPISRFPEIRVARTVENGLYLAVLALWVPLALALFHSLRRTHPAAALFACALNIFGLAVLAAGAIPHVVTSRLSDLYHADGATPDEQATLVLLWQANQGMFDALLLVGLLVMPIGVPCARTRPSASLPGTSAWRSASSGSPRRRSCWSIRSPRLPQLESSPSSASTSSPDGRPTASPRPPSRSRRSTGRDRPVARGSPRQFGTNVAPRGRRGSAPLHATWPKAGTALLPLLRVL